jgi:putative Mg2+ transporter-C (MgtC) family protein
MLVCLGATMTMLLGQYTTALQAGSGLTGGADVTRFGAQVINGIGFLGAGTILVTEKQQVKGLTTAAGLWTAAIVGLSLGAGFYEGGLTVTVLVLLAEILFSQLERLILRKSPEMNLYIHYAGSDTMERILVYLRDNRINVLSMQITRLKESTDHTPTAIFLLRLHSKITRANVLQGLYGLEGVISIDELSC